jgi:hypothetical protein
MNNVYKTIINSENVADILTENIYYKNTVIEDLEKLNTIDKKLYDELYQKLISVGEYNM